MMTAWCYTARIYLTSLRPLTVRKSLACLRWGRPGTFPFDEKLSWFKTQLLAKTTLACWGITELSLGTKCQEAPNKCTQIKGALLSKPVGEKPLGGFFWHLGFSFRLGLRACVLLLKFGPLILLYPWTYLSSGFTSLWLQLLLKATETSGPTFIKLGQWASTRRDLFSEEFCAKFSKLHVKVLHPGLVHQVQMDLFLMKMGSEIIELLPGFKWLSLTEILEEFEKLMIYQCLEMDFLRICPLIFSATQTDLRYEAKNLERFQQNFLDMDFVKFPTPLRPFVTRNILMETFEESEPISQYLHTEVDPELRQRIAKMGMDMLLKMVFVDNFVHADLHPGNILVQGAKHFGATRRDQTTIVDMCDTLIVEVRPSLCQLRLVLLDAGVVAELQEADLQNFRAVFTAVAQGQGERVGELILHHARANQCKDIERFKAEIAELVTKTRMNTIALGKLQVANLLSNVFKLLMTHKEVTSWDRPLAGVNWHNAAEVSRATTVSTIRGSASCALQGADQKTVEYLINSLFLSIVW
ncbi:uncharacterized aarF domain-containing protein kinase 2 isoform X6 [Alligator mississippiensis]|uniref:uncharacterized aarF domain-containing protein kinase 2 isoform X6 n=1 Tax=Alligator mississippiensis TaxID=8496 RepID=UPI0028773E27|nr:uncharacterized aarF domain-containing protein kinase 2 isoform X6 [Alligator mississippiensis]